MANDGACEAKLAYHPAHVKTNGFACHPTFVKTAKLLVVGPKKCRITDQLRPSLQQRQLQQLHQLLQQRQRQLLRKRQLLRQSQRQLIRQRQLIQMYDKKTTLLKFKLSVSGERYPVLY